MKPQSTPSNKNILAIGTQQREITIRDRTHLLEYTCFFLSRRSKEQYSFDLREKSDIFF
jgi:hypothetical protein